MRLQDGRFGQQQYTPGMKHVFPFSLGKFNRATDDPFIMYPVNVVIFLSYAELPQGSATLVAGKRWNVHPYFRVASILSDSSQWAYCRHFSMVISPVGWCMLVLSLTHLSMKSGRWCTPSGGSGEHWNPMWPGENETGRWVLARFVQVELIGESVGNG